MRSTGLPPSYASSIFASRWPFVATIRRYFSRTSQRTPLRMGRLSSTETAKAVCEMSFCRSPLFTRQAFLKSTAGNAGNSSFGNPSNLNFERPHSITIRCSPIPASFTGAGANSRTISLSFLAGTVIPPCASTSAGTSIETLISRSVPEIRSPRSVVSRSRLASTGKVVLAGTAALTAISASWSFSRLMVSRIGSRSKREMKDSRYSCTSGFLDL